MLMLPTVMCVWLRGCPPGDEGECSAEEGAPRLPGRKLDMLSRKETPSEGRTRNMGAALTASPANGAARGMRVGVTWASSVSTCATHGPTKKRSPGSRSKVRSRVTSTYVSPNAADAVPDSGSSKPDAAAA